MIAKRWHINVVRCDVTSFAGKMLRAVTSRSHYDYYHLLILVRVFSEWSDDYRNLFFSETSSLRAQEKLS